MSYDISFFVKTEHEDNEGNRFAVVHIPEYDSPTYNYRKMFVAAMDWDYRQGEYYHMPEVLEKIKLGLSRIEKDPLSYRKYEPENGWGTVEGAIKCMRSWIGELTQPEDGTYDYDNVLCHWPIEALYWRW